MPALTGYNLYRILARGVAISAEGDNSSMSGFRIKQILDAESVYYYDSETSDTVTSIGNRFSARLDGREYRFSIPVPSRFMPFLPFRLCRRALRLDMANVVVNHDRSGLVILYQGLLFFFDLADQSIRQVGRMRHCRNVLYNGIAVTEKGIYFGEYGANTDRAAVPVWCSRDGGRSWNVVHEFAQGSIKHVHGVYVDPFSELLWIPTGDFDGECFLHCVDEDFGMLETFGNGTQQWRPVSLLFEQDKILWGMDSQLETSYLQEFDRATGTLTRHNEFPGPVWYSKQFADGNALLQTVVEVGPGVKSDHAHLYASRDNRAWDEVVRYEKDRWPMRFFKFGVLSFADGPQTSDDFVLFGEGLVDMDGKAVIASVEAPN